MRQKATWFIPGILLTLLLGLLWAMPAFAADAGEISFLDGDGNDISYLSLNGLGGEGNAIMIQVEDQDLNEPTTRTVTAAVGAKTMDTEANTVDWANLADANGDGNVNYQDFTAFVDGSGADADYDQFDADAGETTADDPRRSDAMRQSFETVVTIEPGELTLNTQAGTLNVATLPNDPVNATHLEFEIFESDDISGRDAASEKRLATLSGQGDDSEVSLSFITDVEPTAFNAADTPNAVGDWNWRDILDTNGDGKVDANDVGITPMASADLRDNQNDGSIGAAAVRATNTPKGTPSEPDIVLEYRIDTEFSDSGTPNDPSDDVPADISVRSYRPVNADANATPPVQAIQIANTATLTLNVPLPAYGEEDNRVTLSSDAFPGGISIVMSETAARSGKFAAMLEICDSAEEDCVATQADSGDGAGISDRMGMVTLPVNNAGDTVRVVYVDSDPSRNRSASIPLDVDSPSFSNMAPASGTAGREDEPTVSFDVQDTDSGISEDKDDASSIYVLAGLYSIEGNSLGETIAYERDDLKLEETTSGYTASVSIEEGASDLDADAANAGSEYQIHWWAVSTDLAGNVGVSDSDGDTRCAVPAGLDITDSDGALVALDGTIVAEDEDNDIEGRGCDPFVVRVDAASPELDETQTYTGTWLDGDTEKSGTDAKRTSIVVAFNEALDCSSVDADDFEVDGSNPNGVTCDGSKVYLDVDELDPNDRPDIAVGNESLTDRAGNPIGDEDEITANDGIPAKLSVTVTGTAEGDRPITDGEITIMIESDERLAGNPMVTITKVGANNLLQDDTEGTASPTGAVNQWSYTPSFNADGDDGLYNVMVSGNDLGSGALKLEATTGTMGVAQMDDDDEPTGDYKHDPDDDSAILFEVDNEVQAPAFKPEGSTTNAGAFVRADFADEGKEYGLAEDDDSSAATEDPSMVTTDFDTSGTVTLMSATFNGDDVTADVITRDNVLFVYRPGNLTNGEHTFTIEVMDAAGNEDEFSHEFEKVDKPDYEIALNPGPNLISFPADPADGDVNAVFGGEGNEDIMAVLTFDNATGLWQTATRGADGALGGDLTTINGMNGYWVVSDGVLDVSVGLQEGTDFQPPPHISVTEGWNLVGVVDADQAEAGTEILAVDYFANIDAEVVYGYESLEGKLVRLSVGEGSTDMVETGAAYWVYANEAGIIVP